MKTMTAASEARRAAERRGRRAETWVAWYLRAKGYRVLARRYKSPVGEIDLIVRRGRTIAFVEVKHRPTDVEASEATTPTAQHRIARAASYWLVRHPKATEADLRFDVVVSVPGRLPRHIVAAFDGAGAA
jgi:putative endonuclease